MSLRAIILSIIVVGLLGYLASLGCYVVGQTQEGLLMRLGQPIATIKEPGLYAKLPFLDTVVVYDRRLLPLEPPLDQIILGDQKRIVVETFSRFRVADPLRFYQSVGSVEQARVNLAQLISSTLRKQLGKVALSALLTPQREAIVKEIRDEAALRARPLGVDLVDVRIRRADLPPETSQAIYDRMSSERVREASDLRAQGFEWAQQIRAEAERDRTVLLSRAQRESQINRGEADAEASRIMAAAYGQDTEFFDLYRALQVYRAGLTVGNPTILLSPSSELMKFFDAPFATRSGGAPTTSTPLTEPSRAAAPAPGDRQP